VVGEALIDLVPAGRDGLFEASPGGSPANVAVGLARLDVPVHLAARLSEDVFGRQLRAHLAANGVDLSFAVRAREPTSLAIVAVDPHGGPEYDFRVQATADWQWSDPELAGVPDESVYALHTGSLAATLPPGAEALLRLVERARCSATISYDPNVRPLLMGAPEEVRPRIEKLVALSDVVKVSAEDLNWLAPGRAPAEVAEEWLDRGPALVTVTLGASGALAIAREAGTVRRPGRLVKVVDTVGAGDAFVSALLAALYDRHLLGADQRERLQLIDSTTLAEVVDQAIVASAITCTRRGADPPARAELEAALRT
jgi:fructokinase